MATSIKIQLQNTYLDWFNNYLTIEVFAEHNEITVKEAKIIIELGEQIHEKLVKEYQQRKKG